jgi:hypothetical protein
LATLLDDNELRALRAEASAELTCAEVIGTVTAAEVLVGKTKAYARVVAHGSVEQVNLAQERITKAVVVAKDQIDKAEALADQALERARGAEGELEAAQARASNAEERVEILTDTLRRVPTPSLIATVPDVSTRTLH